MTFSASGIAVISLALGFYLVKRPLEAIELQRKFYEKINWRIEPISLQKEIRNTRIMGIFLMVCVVVFMIAGALM